MTGGVASAGVSRRRPLLWWLPVGGGFVGTVLLLKGGAIVSAAVMVIGAVVAAVATRGKGAALGIVSGCLIAAAVIGGWVYYGQHGLTLPMAVVVAAVVIALAIVCATRMVLRNRA